MRLYLHILVMLAVVLSGVSPACAFISGKSSIIEVEICTADGLKIVKMAGDETPAHDHKHQKKNDCGFCFAQSHLKSAKADAVLFTLPQNAWSQKISFGRSVKTERFELAGLSARAPPLSV